MDARLSLVAWLVGWSAASLAADVPTAGRHDPRVRHIDYVRDQVAVVHVRRGVVTRIMLESGEKIAVAATGFTADCAAPTSEWCIRADVGSNQIWVKPKDGATHNNLELHTDRRDYSLEFTVMPDAPTGAGRVKTGADGLPMYRVQFQYPLSVPLSRMLTDAARRERGTFVGMVGQGTVSRSESPTPRNWDYSVQVLKGGEDIAPSLVFDDGRFTYLRFPGNREVPSVFFVSRDNEEGRVNFHMQDDLMVVQRTARKFVLRLGDAVVGVFNESFDAEGIAPQAGTTARSVQRNLRHPQ